MDTTNTPPKMPPAIAAQILAKLEEAQALAAPYEFSLTPDQRRGGAKMGFDSVSFVESAIAALAAKPDVMPRNFVDATIADTYEGNRTIGPLETSAESLARGLADAQMQLGVVAYDQALQIYSAFKSALKTDSSLQPYVDEMGQRFAKLQGPRPKPTPPQP